MPISASSSTVQPWRIAWCPTVTRAPMVSGAPGSEWPIAPSWKLRLLAQHDRRVVGADHRPEPHAGPRAKADIADQVGRWRDPGGRVDRGRDIVERVERHGAKASPYMDAVVDVPLRIARQSRLGWPSSDKQGTAAWSTMNDPRRAERVPLRADIDFRRAGEHRWRVNILDFSPRGLPGRSCRCKYQPDDTIWISLPGPGIDPGHGLLGEGMGGRGRVRQPALPVGVRDGPRADANRRIG